jgi:hypothetical protein
MARNGVGYSRHSPKLAQHGLPRQARLGNGSLISMIGERSEGTDFDRFDSSFGPKEAYPFPPAQRLVAIKSYQSYQSYQTYQTKE